VAAWGNPGRASGAVGGAVKLGGAVSPYMDGSYWGPEGAEEGDGRGRLVLGEEFRVGLPVAEAVGVGKEGLGAIEDVGTAIGIGHSQPGLNVAVEFR
jgi:hypothetical protein